MNYSVFISVIIVMVILGVAGWLIYRGDQTDKFKESIYPEYKKYKGLCLFDVDGTLTSCSREENELAVEQCLKAGYAVGINTAGAVYTTDNIIGYDNWMPRNLYNFMEKHNFDTFNNVASKLLQGCLNEKAYRDASKKCSKNMLPGYLKGFALEKTAHAYGITDPSKMIIFDDLEWFIQGIKQYNDKLVCVCAGLDCGRRMGQYNKRLSKSLVENTLLANS